ncbi:MAG: hypothetical protein V3V09_04810 [Arenicellales bacterium]
MPLSNEDNLRLNVLTAQPVKAIRINESSMVLTALTDKGEARIDLNPNTQHEKYLREVREFLSEKYLGMPGGYPRHLERWTRMGNTQHSADKMLLLGETEAIVALAYAHNLSAELAEYAWWAHQSPEIARNLLNSPKVADSELAIELANFLLEFLPFEERPLDVVEGVKLCLYKDLISDEAKASLWERAKRKNPYLVGFMLAGPQAIPLDEAAHLNYASLKASLSEEIKNDNDYALYYLHFLSEEGRKWLKLLKLTLKKPTEPNVVIALFICIDHYIALPFERRGVRDIQDAIELAQILCHGNDQPAALAKVIKCLDQTQIEQFKAMLVLAQLGENTLNTVFGGRDATGTVMRKNLTPVFTPIVQAIDTLL